MATLAKKPKQLVLDKIHWTTYGQAVIGVDEVGRGCLAGPVYAAAVLFVHDELGAEMTDSKVLSEKRREELSLKIHGTHPVFIGESSIEEIDELNILWASLLAMKRAVEGLRESLKAGPHYRSACDAPVVVDGHMKIPNLVAKKQIPLVKGDLRCAPVSAASIVAKVARDSFMKQQHLHYPQYGFADHKGYASEFHRTALRAHGPTALHRRSFSGVKELL